MFYRLLNSRLSGRTTIGALTTSDGNIVRSDKDKVELFAQVFGGSFTDCSSLGSPRQSVTESNFSLMQDSVWFHREEILEIYSQREIRDPFLKGSSPALSPRMAFHYCLFKKLPTSLQDHWSISST